MGHNLDLKNLAFFKNIIEIVNFLKRVDFLIAVGFVILCLVISLVIFNVNNGKTVVMKKQTTEKEEMYISFQDIAKVEKELLKATDGYVREDGGAEVVFRNAGSAAGVEIIAISGENKSEDDVSRVKVYTVEFKAKFHSIGKFIGGLESRKDLFLEVGSISLKKINTGFVEGEASAELTGSLTASVRFLK